jgi:polyisoprenoid-binding protein YceI
MKLLSRLPARRWSRLAPLLLAGVALAPTSARATGVAYAFGTAEQRATITFESQADIETILGSSQSLSGSATIDFEGGFGWVVAEVPVASLATGIALRDKHLRSNDWLAAARYPTIGFRSTAARRLEGDRWRLEGLFSLHGVERPLIVNAEVRRIPAEIARQGLGKGEWIKIDAPFEIRLSDFGVAIPSRLGARVSDTWRVRLTAFGTTRP